MGTFLSRFTAFFCAAAVAAPLVFAACGSAAASQSSSSSLLNDVKQRGVLRVGIRIDDPPHGFVDAQGKWVGFDVDVANAISKRLGVRLELTTVDELTRISFIQNGKIDLAMASISKTQKRAATVDFSETYFFSTQSFLVRKGQISSLKDLAGKRVGADRGSSASANWQAFLKAHGYADTGDIVLYGDKHAAVDAVKQGVIVGWAEDYEILASFAKNEPSLAVLNEPGGIGLKLDGIAMRKNDSTLMLSVNLALQDIAATGEYRTIYDRWFGPDSATPVPLQGGIEVWPHG